MSDCLSMLLPLVGYGAWIVIPAIVGVVYLKRRRVLWNAILAESILYHRHHLELGLAQGDFRGLQERRAREMLQVVTRQFPRERKEYRGLRSLAVMRLSAKSTLVSLDELTFQIFRENPWGAHNDDDTLMKLLRTFQSTVYRYLLLNSMLGLPALLYMDGMLVSARVGIAKGGSKRLYRDIADALRK